MALFDKSTRIPLSESLIVRTAWRLRVWIVILALAAANLAVWVSEDSSLSRSVGEDQTGPVIENTPS